VVRVGVFALRAASKTHCGNWRLWVAQDDHGGEIPPELGLGSEAGVAWAPEEDSHRAVSPMGLEDLGANPDGLVSRLMHSRIEARNPTSPETSPATTSS
jgi:hypothetical protein